KQAFRYRVCWEGGEGMKPRGCVKSTRRAMSWKRLTTHHISRSASTSMVSRFSTVWCTPRCGLVRSLSSFCYRSMQRCAPTFQSACQSISCCMSATHWMCDACGESTRMTTIIESFPTNGPKPSEVRLPAWTSTKIDRQPKAEQPVPALLNGTRSGLSETSAGQATRYRRRGDRVMGWMAPFRHRRAKLVFCRITRNREPSMSEVTTIGLDLAKHVFQVHGIDAQGATVLRKRLRRGQVLAFFSRIPRCLVGLEACATAHYWARELAALGHEVRLMPAQYMKADLKRKKHDAADAEAICEAVQRPTMRFVPVKTAEQQAAQLLHRGREQLVRQRTMLVNALRAHLAEFGMVAAQGLRNVAQLIAIVRDEDDLRLPDVARQVLQVLANQIEQIEAAITALEKQLMAWHKTNPVSQRLASIPGIGPIIATAIATTVADPGVFRSGREFGAWLGLVPRQNSTGGKTRLGGITKRGNRYLRRLLI